MEKYNFLTIEGKLLNFNSMKEAGNYFRQQGVVLSNSAVNSFWNYLNGLCSNGEGVSRKEAEFLKKYKLSFSLWNCGVLEKIKAVYLYPLKLEELKKEGLIWER